MPDVSELIYDFEGYRIWRADNWDRPFGTSLVNGPAKRYFAEIMMPDGRWIPVDLALAQRIEPTVFADDAQLIHARTGAFRFVLPVASPRLAATITEAVRAAGIEEVTRVVEGRSLDAMRAADVVLIASGTAVLEAALLGKPAVAAYRVAAFTAWLVRRFRLINISHFTIPNLLTEEPLIPEFIQEAATPGALADAVNALLSEAATWHAGETAADQAQLSGPLSRGRLQSLVVFFHL